MKLSNQEYVANQNHIIQERYSQPFDYNVELFKPTINIDKLLTSEIGNENHSIAGRITNIRGQGKVCFFDIKDFSGKIQCFIKKDNVGEEEFLKFKDLNLGDIVGLSGVLFETKTKQITLNISEFILLTKNIRPLPEKFHGLSDVESRYRKRYFDLIVNDDVREIFKSRSKIISQIRRYFEDLNYYEVETPMLHPIQGGANAKPFTTHHNSLDLDLYLRIAPELYLKKLLVGGFEKVFEINRNFRNEGLSTKHNPEFTSIEFYSTYSTYEDLMQLTEDLIGKLCKSLHNKTNIQYGEHNINFESPWERMTMRESLLKYTNVRNTERETLLSLIDDESKGTDELLVEAFEKYVEKELIQPTFIMDYPKSISPLAKTSKCDPNYVDRFELFIAGMELANGFNELNDPLEQRNRFLDQLDNKDGEGHPLDNDYIEALEVGLPPTAGEGIGIDRLVMLLTNSDSIKEVILFPQMRPHKNEQER